MDIIINKILSVNKDNEQNNIESRNTKDIFNFVDEVIRSCTGVSVQSIYSTKNMPGYNPQFREYEEYTKHQFLTDAQYMHYKLMGLSKADVDNICIVTFKVKGAVDFSELDLISTQKGKIPLHVGALSYLNSDTGAEVTYDPNHGISMRGVNEVSEIITFEEATDALLPDYKMIVWLVLSKDDIILYDDKELDTPKRQYVDLRSIEF